MPGDNGDNRSGISIAVKALNKVNFIDLQLCTRVKHLYIYLNYQNVINTIRQKMLFIKMTCNTQCKIYNNNNNNDQRIRMIKVYIGYKAKKNYPKLKYLSVLKFHAVFYILK